jgi:phospholipid transport system substrate-binding protein
MKKFFFSLFLIIQIHCSAYAVENTQSPIFFLEDLVNEVTSTLKNDLSITKDHLKMEAYVRNNIIDQFDMSYLTYMIVGEKVWIESKDSDRVRLISEISQFFTHIFAKTLAEYDGKQTLTFDQTSTILNAENVVLTGKLHDPSDETMPFTFKVIKVASEWKIYNVNLGGIDLINTYKSNFKQIVATGGVAKLADELHKKNQTVAAGGN